MRVLVQRVSQARVIVAGKEVGRIEKGLLLLVGVVAEDSEKDQTWMVNKVINLRIFEDPQGKMNLNLQQVGII